MCQVVLVEGSITALDSHLTTSATTPTTTTERRTDIDIVVVVGGIKF